MAKKDSTILYHDQMAICRKYLTTEQIGRLIVALFEFEEGGDPVVDEDIGLAFEFLSLQAKIDRKKYEERCNTNRLNGLKGGAPKGNQNAKKQPKQPNAKKNNPNDNDNDDDNETIMIRDNNDDDTGLFHHDHLSLGSFSNVQLTDEELGRLRDQYERPEELIDKVSLWLRSAKNPVPDHYALCVKFATNDQWPKRRRIEPVEEIVIEDPLTEEEQERKVLEMRARINGAFAEG